MSKITPESLSKLTGLPEKELRSLADQGFFPSAVKGQYELIPAVTGVFKHLRQEMERKSEWTVKEFSQACAIDVRRVGEAADSAKPLRMEDGKPVYALRDLVRGVAESGAAGVPEFMTITALANFLRTDRETITRIVRDVKPAKTVKGRIYYGVAHMQAAWQARRNQPENPIREKILGEQFRRLLIANDEKAAKLVDKAKVHAAIVGTAATQKALLLQKLENEAPAMVPGLEPDQRAALRVVLKEVADSICEAEQKLSDAWAI